MRVVSCILIMKNTTCIAGIYSIDLLNTTQLITFLLFFFSSLYLLNLLQLTPVCCPLLLLPCPLFLVSLTPHLTPLPTSRLLPRPVQTQVSAVNLFLWYFTLHINTHSPNELWICHTVVFFSLTNLIFCWLCEKKCDGVFQDFFPVCLQRDRPQFRGVTRSWDKV